VCDAGQSLFCNSSGSSSSSGGAADAKLIYGVAAVLVASRRYE
jgi:hypothetical protein